MCPVCSGMGRVWWKGLWSTFKNRVLVFKKEITLSNTFLSPGPFGSGVWHILAMVCAQDFTKLKSRFISILFSQRGSLRERSASDLSHILSRIKLLALVKVSSHFLTGRCLASLSAGRGFLSPHSIAVQSSKASRSFTLVRHLLVFWKSIIPFHGSSR